LHFVKRFFKKNPNFYFMLEKKSQIVKIFDTDFTVGFLKKPYI